jgi:phosphatidylserine/phosphatidylglycerophosphate/cardiolipin synthase-like enzyme
MWRRSLPEGLSFTGDVHAASNVAFLADLTWVDTEGSRHSSQKIFDAAFEMIRRARRLVLLDMFLYNDFPMGVSNPIRPLTRQLTDLLLQQKQTYPDIRIIVITDPVNTFYGSVASSAYAELRTANIDVVITDLERLRDSNPVYSIFWRLFIRPLGNSSGGQLPNPFDPHSKVTLRSYLAMPNFKANHRKVLVTDHGDELVGMVTSANPHDASSANTNVACTFDGAAVNDLLSTENSVLKLCKRTPLIMSANGSKEMSAVTVQVLTERAIKLSALDIINNRQRDERVDLASFYLADRDIIKALKRATSRGVRLRVLLDPNKDAFGHNKFGIPNRSVAADLTRSGIEVRWGHTHGEQYHDKMLLGVNDEQQAQLLIGSANLTRRDLDDFNLETNVLIRAPLSVSVMTDAVAHFDCLWRNRPDQVFSVPYEQYRDESVFKRGLYRFMEATGFSTF